jgi:fumarate reductase flavoprotein subunit
MQRYMMASAFLSLVVGLFSSCASSTMRGGPVPTDRLANGVYRGSARNGPVSAVVDVIVKDQVITEIKLIRHRSWRGGEAEEAIPDLIIEQQSTNVDAVAGATISSTAIMNAVQDAVEKATN